jgi:hypothetical protein
MANPHLLLYMASFFLIAIPFSGLGSLIPFLAADLGIEEMEYSLLFVLVSVGSVLAALLYKFIESQGLLPKHHTVCMIDSLGMIIFCLIMANMKTRISQSIIYSIFGMLAYAQVITINICLMTTPAKEDVGLWLSFSHGIYGVGALVGPIVVSYLQQNLFIALAIAFAVLAPCFYFLNSPEHPVSQG